MQELRFVAVSEDGRYAVLAVPGRSARFTLPIDERLRAVALGQTSRLVQYEIEVESPLRPKEIQARIRAGETVEEIADAAGIAVERVRWFEGPVLAERAYMADQAQSASVRRQGDATPGPRLGEIVTERMKLFGADPEDAQWDAKKRGDGSWLVELTFISGGRLHTAEWIFDPRRRHVLPADDNAARMSLPGTEPPQPVAPAPGEATVTHLAPRLSAAPGHGPGHGQPVSSGSGLGQPGTSTSGFGPGAMGSAGNGNGFGHGSGPGGGISHGGPGGGGRARHERPGSGRPVAPQPQVAQPQVAQPQVAQPQVAQPQVAQPQVAQPQVAQPQVAQPQVAQPQVAQPQVAEPEAPEPREPEAPAAAVTTPPVSPATVAAHVQPGGDSQAERAADPARHARPAQEPGVAQARQEMAVAAPTGPADPAAPATPAAAASPAVPVTAASPVVPVTAAGPAAQAVPVPSSAEAVPSVPAEPAAEQAVRQGRKAARGRRSSVPSWDEIMFGNSRQRD